jgi:hypothetical protein
MADPTLNSLAQVIAAVRLEAKTSATAKLNSRAVFADGNVLARADVLKRLNLNPNTPPEAWLAIVACGSNASALDLKAAQELHGKGVLNAEQLAQVSALRGG